MVEALAGRGGMSVVYRALDRHTGRTVALKIFKDKDHHAVERFTREVELLANLEHPAVVEHIDHGLADTSPYLAMEWLEGEDLCARLARGPLDVDEVITLATRVAEALTLAHERGIVHRDVKPSNIFLPSGEIGQAKILDFGIAKVRGGAQFTRFGEALGTPAYMSPEQAKGGGEIDARADVFALGCVLFECISGKPPFWADHPLAVMAKILIDEPPKLDTLRGGVPGPLVALVERMLKKDPAERPSDGRAVAEAVRAIGHARKPPPPADSAPSTPTLTSREQKLLSVLFVARMSELEEARADAYQPTMFVETTAGTLDAVYAEVLKHGGWAERLVDGSIVVTLPGQGPVLEQAARAARCSLAVAHALPLHPMALVTGRAEVGGGFPVGAVIDRGVALLARGVARLSEDRPVTGIAIDEVTAGLLDRRFEIGEREGELELVSERDGGDAPRTLLGKSHSFVGRDRELKRLLLLYETCVSEELAQAVIVTGEPGVGKSRLGWELIRAVESRHPTPTIMLGRAASHLTDVPLSLLSGALSSLFALHSHESLEVAQHRVRARVGRYVPKADRERVAAFIGELVGVRFDDAAHPTLATARRDRLKMGDLIRTAWEELLAAELHAGPTLIMLEDVHVADSASMALLDNTLRLFADKRLLIVALARHEVDQAFGSLWRARPLVRFELGPLSRSAAEELGREVLGERASEEAIARVVDKASGNAFYLEELLRAVATGRAELPETVLAMVQARLDALDAEARRALRAASILGDSCSLGAIKALLRDRDAASVTATLAQLCEAELLASASNGNTSGETMLSFPNALIREAAYSTLTEEDRKLGHTLAAEWLAEEQKSRDAAIIADHFEKAGDARRAAAFCARAAELALEAHDFASAIARAERGAQAGVTGPLLGRIQLLLSEAHRQLGNNEAMLDAARRAIELLPRRSPPWWAAIANTVQAALRLGSRSTVDDVVAAIGPAPFGDLPAGATRAAHYLGVGGRGEIAEALLGQAMADIGEFAADPTKWAWGYRAHCTRAVFAGNTGTAIEQLDLAIRAFEAAGDLREAATERVNLALMQLDLGLNDEARATLRGSLDVAERWGLRHLSALASIALSVAEARRGYYSLARSLAHTAIAFFREQGDRRMGGYARTALARLLLLQGELDQAQKECEAGQELLSSLPTLLPANQATHAQVLLAQGRAADALHLARSAMEALTRGVKLDEGEAQVRLAFAEALIANGQQDKALVGLSVAYERLSTRALAIKNSAWRKGFLESVPENQRTMELYRELNAIEDAITRARKT